MEFKLANRHQPRLVKTPPFARRRPTEIYNDVVDEFQRTPEGEQRSTGFSRVSIIIGSAVNASFPLIKASKTSL